jgi:SH3 domain-containing YSC84-like protein 1
MILFTRRLPACSVALITAVASAFAQGDQQKRLEQAGTVMQQILDAPDNIPQKLLDHAKCVVVLPSVVKSALGVGSSDGRGAMVCRTGPNFDGTWGAPVMYSLQGGSFGFQIGGQATDIVLLVMNKSGVRSLLRTKVKLGTDASIAAGPKGRATAPSTDAYLQAEVLSYSRSRGVFAGVLLQGATLHPDDSADNALYGQQLSARQIVQGPNRPAIPPSAHMLDNELTKASPHGAEKS